MKYILILLFIVSGKCGAQYGFRNYPLDSLSKYRNVGDTGGGNPSIGNYGTWFGGDVSAMDTISWWRSSANTHIGPDTLPVVKVIAVDTFNTFGTFSASDFMYDADTIYLIGNLYKKEDTTKVIMQVSDTLRSSWDTKIYWIKGYRVNGDYETYYLDISKKKLPKHIIVWIDQNL